MAVNRKGRPRKRRDSAKKVRDRMEEAEATLEAIRTGQVDALVVSGPQGDQTLTIEGASHPYFVLLDAMGDGAVLLEPDGAILFGNRSFGEIAGAPIETLRGSSFQRLLVSAERASFEDLLREGASQKVSDEFTLLTASESTTPVAISISKVPLGVSTRAARSKAAGSDSVLMAIITDLTYRKAAESTRTRLLARLISAEDDERRRIARELHDETGQSLTALLVGLRAIADTTQLPEVRHHALQLRDVAAQTITDVGRLARGLHPAVLDDKGLAAAATRYVHDYEQAFGMVLDFASGDVDSPPLAPLTAATMYRILQEALTNVARHARAKHVAVELNRDGFELELLVRDDGVGFEVNRTLDSASGGGFGLHGMRERVALLGGSMHIESTPKRGTLVHARIPADRNGAASRTRPQKRPNPARKKSRS